EFNDTLTAYSNKKTITDLFEEQVEKTPENIALRQDNISMSYLELNERANRLANYLVKLGVQKGSNVGLIATRSFNMIVGMYAIMKAGAAYVPIDPEYPIDRQEYILNNSSAELIISDSEYALGKKNTGFRVVNFENADLNDYSKDNPGISVDSTQLAYTIYTSGSTGLPKGVMIEHHSAVNLIEWVNSRFNVNADDRLLFITSMCFDLSVYDIFGMLASGGSIVIANQHEVIDVNKLKELLQQFKITFWDSVPTTMNYLIKELIAGKANYLQTDLRLIFMSGDWIPVQLPGEIKEYFPNARVISLGGATEATVWSNYFPVTEVKGNWASIPYGKPIANNFFYVLNEQLQPVPRGVTGELYIGGVGVARGYANDPEKTTNSFIPDPFNKSAGGRMYRTGDLGRMLADGNLEFLGRKDTQVKIRGYRVELGEIESVLNQHALINQAVVMVKTDKERNKVLTAYIVPKNNFDRTAILSYLKSKLPDYMVPALLIDLPQFPLTSNGKIDKKALSDLDIPEPVRHNYEAPQTENQKRMATIWQEILGAEKVGIHDNFFELGGHSLIAVRMITRLEKEMGAKLPLAILFKYPTISSLLSFIEKGNKDTRNTWKSLVPIKASGTKMPLYIIHGSGLNVLSFSDIAMYVDADQPVFGLQAKGLNSIEDASDDMSEIAGSYISEILEHNPDGPYAIAGYSFGGYVAVEMRKQLEAMGKEVKMLAIFDTNAVDADHYRVLTKIKRQFPKLIWFIRSLFKHPGSTLSYQAFLLRKNIKNISAKVMGTPKAEANDFYSRLEEINRKHWRAFRKYNLTPFNDLVYLFRARERIYFVDDFKYLGWNKFAKKGVRVYDVSGDHRTMLLPPHAKKFASALQEALDNC
ncbi:MAG TPA: amino acid adenylation domain-containing protein, partial [Sphingobacteriaceae bacterium]